MVTHIYHVIISFIKSLYIINLLSLVQHDEHIIWNGSASMTFIIMTKHLQRLCLNTCLFSPYFMFVECGHYTSVAYMLPDPAPRYISPT